VTKYLMKKNFEEERFILIHGFRGFNAWSFGLIVVGL
jgi:hypothetical protein